ncbi:MAG: ribosome assembly RNA-binding protein YhbY [Gammaproteobacteria bacterium]
MALTPKTRQELKAKAHKLKPVVMIGNKGLTEAVHKEIDIALHHHELIKIRIATTDRELKEALYSEICTTNKAEPVQLIGNTVVIYRKNKDE